MYGNKYIPSANLGGLSLVQMNPLRRTYSTAQNNTASRIRMRVRVGIKVKDKDEGQKNRWAHEYDTEVGQSIAH